MPELSRYDAHHLILYTSSGSLHIASLRGVRVNESQTHSCIIERGNKSQFLASTKYFSPIRELFLNRNPINISLVKPEGKALLSRG